MKNEEWLLDKLSEKLCTDFRNAHTKRIECENWLKEHKEEPDCVKLIWENGWQRKDETMIYIQNLISWVESNLKKV